MLPRVRRRLGRGLQRFAHWMMPPAPPSTHFYSQQPTCQIPHLWLLYSRFLGERADGTFVELGGYDGVLFSNTWGLASRGWRGWIVEPVPEFADLCTRHHAGHPSVTVCSQAVAGPGQTTVTMHIGGPLSTANPEQRKEYTQHGWSRRPLTERRIEVPSCTLDEFLERERVPTGFDVLGIDVEGFEAAVFSGFDLPRWRPRMMIIEMADIHPTLSGTMHTDAALGARILEAGYVTVAKDHINTVFVRRDVWAAAFDDV